MSAFSKPIILKKSGEAEVLNRVSLGTGEHSFSEKWLQETLFNHPECLPVREIDARIGNLIPVCMELETGAGPADILYVTETGYLVLVETKLWRNPEARRVVVAQILDYAKQLTTWSFNDLSRETAMASKKGSSHLLDCVRKVNPSIDEASFVDGVSNSLKNGDFLLLIVGDGIRSGTESLVGFISQYGNLRFGFGLIEVATYGLPNEDVLITPRILAKTEILERTVIVGKLGEVSIEEPSQFDVAEIDQSLEEKRQWFQAFWTDYLKLLKLDDLNQPLPTTIPKSTNIFFSMPSRIPGAIWISAYIAQGSHQCGVYLTFSKTFEQSQLFYERLYNEKDSIEQSIGSNLNWVFDGTKVSIAITQSIQDLREPSERINTLEYLTNTTNKMINAFRHRLESYLKED